MSNFVVVEVEASEVGLAAYDVGLPLSLSFGPCVLRNDAGVLLRSLRKRTSSKFGQAGENWGLH